MKRFADDAYRNALKDRKKSIVYDNLCKLHIQSHSLQNFLCCYVENALCIEKLRDLHLLRLEKMFETFKQYIEK